MMNVKADIGNDNADSGKLKATSGKLKSDSSKLNVASGKHNTDPAHLKVDYGHKKLNETYRHTALPGGKDIHIGYTIGRLLTKLQLSATTLATLLGISRQSAHSMLKKKYLHAATLINISEALQHDVIRYLYPPEHLPANPKLKERVEELEKENEGLKKEVVMLEKMVKLLEKKG